MSHEQLLSLRFTADKLLLIEVVKKLLNFTGSVNCQKLSLPLQVSLHKMNLRTGILLLLALAKATAERYYDEKSSYSVKSSGESEGTNYHRIQFNLLGIQ